MGQAATVSAHSAVLLAAAVSACPECPDPFHQLREGGAAAAGVRDLEMF